LTQRGSDDNDEKALQCKVQGAGRAESNSRVEDAEPIGIKISGAPGADCAMEKGGCAVRAEAG
jgi:hypothetical protein